LCEKDFENFRLDLFVRVEFFYELGRSEVLIRVLGWVGGGMDGRMEKLF
jgi:hypothetical protein